MIRIVTALALAASAAAIIAAPCAAAERPSQAAIEKAARALFTAMAEGRFEDATTDFDEAMRTALPPDKLQASWETLVKQAGAFKGQGRTRVANEYGYDVVYVRLDFEGSALDGRVVVAADGRITGLWFVPAREDLEWTPPPYADPAAFEERELTVGSGEWALPATLSLPKGEGPFPAIILVHGSGPQDRNEAIGPNRPFQDLAWGLASRGVAVLRYDKRTKVYGPRMAGMVAEITVKEETVDDAVLAVDLLRGVEGVDASRVHVLGHSLGGMLVPRIAARAPGAAGFVIMAGTTRPLPEVMLEQVEYISSLGGDSKAVEEYLADLKTRVAAVESTGLTASTPAGELPFGVPPAYWLDLRGYDPAAAAKTIARPILILQGERDYQVTLEDFDGWKKALAGRPDVTFRLYPSLNHLFIEGVGKSVPSEYEKPGHVAQQVVDDIAAWIRAGGPARL